VSEAIAADHSNGDTGAVESDMTDLRELAELAERLAGEAAALTLERLPQARSHVRTKSSATDMVSDVDEASERLIVEGIRRARPGDGILSEEGASAETTTGVRWVIDPIDGTTNYLYGHPGYAISIAAEVDGQTALGVVNDPIHGDRFAAIRGGEATRNGAPIEVSGETELGSALVATGFAYTAPARIAQAELLVRLIGSIRDIRRMGAAAVDLCSVACGRVDCFYERGLNRWDLAAGALIAETAGATVDELDDGTVIAAPPALFEPLRRALIAARAPD
jgi:myo-inositol-1(or 4)-monophosphatase